MSKPEFNVLAHQRNQYCFEEIYISDTHLGSPNCASRVLLAFLNAITSNHYYLIGDMIDGQRMRAFKPFWPSTHEAILAQFNLRAADPKTTIDYISGNHDGGLAVWMAAHGISTDDNRQCLKYRGINFRQQMKVDNPLPDEDGVRQPFMAIHGDRFDSTLSHGLLPMIGDALYDVVSWLDRVLNHWTDKFKLPHIPFARTLKHAFKTVVGFLTKTDKRLAGYVGNHGHKRVFSGHTHYAGRKMIHDIECLNTGDWVASMTAIARNKNGKLVQIDFFPIYQQYRRLHNIGDPDPSRAFEALAEKYGAQKVEARSELITPELFNLSKDGYFGLKRGGNRQFKTAYPDLLSLAMYGKNPNELNAGQPHMKSFETSLSAIERPKVA